MKKYLKRFYDQRLSFVFGGQTIIFLIVGIVGFILLIWLRSIYKIETSDVIVEAHGMLMDIFIFGIIITLYDAIKERKNRTRHYQEEIDDFRQWDEKEATFRIVGNIRRLNRLGVHKIYLDFTYLCNASLSMADLRNAYLTGSNLSSAEFLRANLSSADLTHAILFRAKLVMANLSGANLEDADMTECNCVDADFSGAIFYGTIIKKAYFKNSIFNGAKAYISQKEDFKSLGVDVSVMIWEHCPY